MAKTFDVVVVGGGIVGASTAFHLAELGERSVALLERGEICSGGTAKSCAIIRSHYSVPSNTELTLRSLEMFRDFPAALGEDDVECGFINSGYLILAGPGSLADRLSANLEMQSGVGAETFSIDAETASELHPLLRLDDVAALGFEPRSGYADPVQTTRGFVRAARRRGVTVMPHTPVQGLRLDSEAQLDRPRVTGVETAIGPIHADVVVSALGPWTPSLFGAGRTDLGTPSTLHLEVSRHVVLTFEGDTAYGSQLPIVKDLTTSNKMYFRPSEGGVVLVGTGDHGDPVPGPDEMVDWVPGGLLATQREQVVARMPSFVGAELAGSWVGPYDITPDWNPVLGESPDLEGLYLTYGFSGHGFKLAPAVGRCVAQTVLKQTPDVDLTPYRQTRFDEDALLVGAYGIGSIS